MGKLKDYTKYLKSITEKEQVQQLERIIKDHEKVVLDLNRRQLFAGEDSDGIQLLKYKSKSYAEFKRKLNPRGVTDLRLTGEFHNNFFLVSEVPLIIWSYDAKTDLLVDKYGKTIFGLTDESIKALMVGYIKKEYQEYFKKLIQL